MGVVHLFGTRERVEENQTSNLPQDNVNDNATAEVVELVINKNIARGVPAKTIYRQMETLLVNHGVDMTDPKIRSDYKIVTYLVQGMMDRVEGVSSDRCLLLDTLRHTLAYEDPLPSDTDELFGDLLGRLD